MTEYGKKHTDGSRSGGQEPFDVEAWLSQGRANRDKLPDGVAEALGPERDWADEVVQAVWPYMAAKDRGPSADAIRTRCRPIGNDTVTDEWLASAGICAFDRDECTVTLALDTEALGPERDWADELVADFNKANHGLTWEKFLRSRCRPINDTVTDEWLDDALARIFAAWTIGKSPIDDNGYSARKTLRAIIAEATQ